MRVRSAKTRGSLSRSLFLAVLGAGIILSSSCASTASRGGFVLQRTDVRLEEASFSGILLIADLDIDNPLPDPARRPSFSYSISANGRTIKSAEGVLDDNIEASGVTRLSIPIEIDYAALRSEHPDLTQGDEISYLLSGSVDMTAGEETRRIEFERSGRFPILREPIFAVGELTLIEGGNLRARISVSNPNPFSVDASALRFTIENDAGSVMLLSREGGLLDAGGDGLIIAEASVAGDLEFPIDAAEAVRLVPHGSILTPYGPIAFSQGI